ncbi:hypothetical protein D1159_17790 [Pseudoflavonifractor sp. 524-17]|nr:hypothetical protein [Pseudoflavonifractor sp. 524-17]
MRHTMPHWNFWRLEWHWFWFLYYRERATAFLQPDGSFPPKPSKAYRRFAAHYAKAGHHSTKITILSPSSDAVPIPISILINDSSGIHRGGQPSGGALRGRRQGPFPKGPWTQRARGGEAPPSGLPQTCRRAASKFIRHETS